MSDSDNEQQQQIIKPEYIEFLEEDTFDGEFVQDVKRKAKPKVTVVWPQEEVRALIHAVRKHQSIWGYGTSERRSLDERMLSWCAIDKLLTQRFRHRFGTEECKAKWSNVKTVYTKVKTKYLNIKPRKFPTWIYWNDMQFIERNNVASITANNSSENEEEEDSFDDNTMKNILEIKEQDADLSYLIDTRTVSSSFERKRKLSMSPPALGHTPVKHFASQCIERASNEKERKNMPTKIETDVWQIVGDYLGAQLREIAKRNTATADRLHRTLTRNLLDTLDELDARQRSTNL